MILSDFYELSRGDRLSFRDYGYGGLGEFCYFWGWSHLVNRDRMHAPRPVVSLSEKLTAPFCLFPDDLATIHRLDDVEDLL